MLSFFQMKVVRKLMKYDSSYHCKEVKSSLQKQKNRLSFMVQCKKHECLHLIDMRDAFYLQTSKILYNCYS